MVLVVVSWVVVTLLGFAAVTATFGVSSRKLLAIAHDGLPYLLILAWPIMIVAAVEQEWPLAAAAAVLVAYHLALMIPRIRADRVPRWVVDAPRLELVVANVFVNNTTPEEMARQLVATNADVIVVAEWNDRFAAAFEAAGGGTAYPHRLCNDCDDPAYVVTVASRIPLDEESKVVTLASSECELIVTHAVVHCGSRAVGILAVHPTAIVDPNGYNRWKAQLDAMIAYIPNVSGPFLIAGDFNSTRYRPEFQRLLATGLIDAHDTLGRGLSTSFRLATKGALAAAGTIVRLDHALLSDGLWPIRAKDLEACGSDHLPFSLTLAIRPNTKLDTVGVSGPVMSRSET